MEREANVGDQRRPVAKPHFYQTPGDPGQAAFATTHWSVVLAARDDSIPGASEALERLCTIYWYPIYAFTRRLGYERHDAKDFTQGFFAHLLEKGALSRVEEKSGRFRSFLLGALKLYIAESHRKANAIKRGGQAKVISIDADLGEERYQHEPMENRTPETLYHRSWAEALLNLALARLRQDYAKGDKLDLFEELQPYLAGGSDLPSYPKLAERLGLSVNGVTTAVFRLRKRYSDHVKQAVAETIRSEDEIEVELRFLFSVLET